MFRAWLKLFATSAFAVAVVRSSHAATITVCGSGCDYANLQQAIDASAPGDVISVGSGVYTHTSSFTTLGKAITIRGAVDADGTPATILDGQGQRRVLLVSQGEGAGTVLENLVVRNGVAYGPIAYGGGLLVSGASPRFVNCVFTANFVQGWSDAGRGGGIHLSGSNATFVRCTVRGNHAYGPNSVGGGMHLESSAPLIQQCVFDGNSAPTGGYGGAIFSWGLGTTFPTLPAVIVDSVFVGNSAGYQGGAVFVTNRSISLSGCTISANAVTLQSGRGAGVYLYDATVSATNTIICGNTVQYGSQVDGGGVASWVDGGGNCVSASCIWCYRDYDGDGVANEADNCPAIANPGQADCDQDGLGDACELAAGAVDVNHDGVPDTCQCLADIDLDAVVGGADLALLLGAWGGDAKAAALADVDDDGQVDATDLSLLLAAWGPCGGG